MSVSYNETLGVSRSSARQKEARDKEEEEIKAGAVSDNDAEDADEDSEGPGSNRGRTHSSSGVHKDPDNVSSGRRPSTTDGTRGSGSADRSIHHSLGARF